MALTIIIGVNSLLAGFLLGHGWCRLTGSRVRIEIVSGIGPGLLSKKPAAENLAKPVKADDNADDPANDADDTCDNC